MMFRRLWIFSFWIGLLLVNINLAVAQACSAQDVDAWQSQADNDAELGNYEEAIQGYTCMIDISDEQDAYAYQWRGISKHILGLQSEAMDDLQQSIALDPSQGSVYYSRGNLFADLDEYELAIDDYTTAISKGYTYEGVYLNRGFVHNRLGDRDLAKADYQQAVRINPEMGLAYNNLGAIAYVEGDMEAALSNYDLGILYGGDNQAVAYLNRGDYAYIEQDYATALKDFTEGIESDPEFASLYLARANAYLATQSPNAYADYLRWIQTIQTEIIDLESKSIFVDESLDMVEGRVYRVSVDLESGQVWSIIANATIDADVDPLLLLLGPSGSPIFGDDDHGPHEDAVIYQFPIAQSGTYTLLITYSDEGDSGEIILNSLVGSVLAHQIITYQLAVGERAQVYAISNDGSGLVNLRSYPGLGFEVLEQVTSGTHVQIVNGPFKEQDFVWWQVELEDGMVGWMAEVIGGVQTLHLALAIGGEAIINAPELNFRIEPSVDAELVTSLFREARVVFDVIDGPVTADNFTWWQVRFPDGKEGWAVERVNDTHTLVAILDN